MKRKSLLLYFVVILFAANVSDASLGGENQKPVRTGYWTNPQNANNSGEWTSPKGTTYVAPSDGYWTNPKTGFTWEEMSPGTWERYGWENPQYTTNQGEWISPTGKSYQAPSDGIWYNPYTGFGWANTMPTGQPVWERIYWTNPQYATNPGEWTSPRGITYSESGTNTITDPYTGVSWTNNGNGTITNNTTGVEWHEELYGEWAK